MGSSKGEEGEKITAIESGNHFHHKPASSNGEITLSPASEKRHHLSEDEQRILNRQIDAPSIQASYFMLYRYATKADLAIIAISVICAVAAGAAFPLMTVSFSQHHFQAKAKQQSRSYLDN